MAFNIHSTKGGSLLHTAAFNSSLEELQSLLDSGLEVNSVDFKGRTPLHCAIWANFELGVDLLLDRGANINSTSNAGDTPLHFAAWKVKKTLFEKLILKGADVNIQNKKGFSVLHIVCIFRLLPFGNVLLLKGVNVNAKDIEGNTPLHFATKAGNIEFIKRLLSEGADVNSKNYAGESPLHFAAKFCYNRSVIKLLLIGGSDVHAKDKGGRTPMHFAVYKSRLNNTEIVTELLQWGASLFVKDESDEDPYERASCLYEVNYVLKRHSTQLNCVRFRFDPIQKFDITGQFFMSCEREAQRMKQYRFDRHLLSDVFDKYGDPTYLSNSKLKQAFMSDMLEIDFPIYASLLRSTFERAKRRAALLDVGQYCLTDLLPVEIVRYILSFVGDDDLQNVVKTGKC